jgi:PAS domain S-box-containing protein
MERIKRESLSIMASGLLRVVLKIALVIFAVEGSVMLSLEQLPIGNNVLATLMDATLLILISSPVIYFWIIKPYIHARDVAQDKTQELEASEARWKFALESGGEGVWDWNIKSGEVVLSNQCKAVLGVNVDEVETFLKDWESTIHPDDISRLKAALHAHLNGKTDLYQNEHRVLLKGGGWRWILTRGKVMSRDANNQPLRMIGTQCDVTDRKEAEVSMHLASLVYKNSSEAMMVTDGNGIIITVNPAFTKLTGYTADEVIGHTPNILSSGLQSKAFYEGMWGS